MISVRACLVVLALAALAHQTEGQAPTVSAADLRLVTEIPAADDEIFFAHIGGIAVAAAGRIFVLDTDMKEPSICAFNPDGSFSRTIGRVGSGPGEYRRPFPVLVRGTELHVADGVERRWVRFTLEGAHLGTERFDENDSRIGAIPYALRGGAALMITSPTFSSNPTVGYDPHHRILIRAAGAASFDTLAVIRGDAIGYRDARRFGMAFSGAGEGGAWALSGDSLLAVANGYDGSVRWYAVRDGRPLSVRSAQVSIRPRPFTAGDRSQLYDRLRRRLRGSEALTFDEPPPFWSHITRAVFADDGALWLGHPADDHRTLWTVFPLNSRSPAYTVALPPNFTLHAVHGDRLYGSSVADDEPVVRVYALSRR